jgi:hypothetical protein
MRPKRESWLDMMTLTPSSTRALAGSIRGEVVIPGDRDYDQQRRVWNGSIDRHPVLIVQCQDTKDVKAALRFAREHRLLTAVRGGGHSFPGLSTCDGGMVIDLGAMNAVRFDPERHTVRVQAGALLADVDRETLVVGQGVPSGIVSHTGVAGLTLGGGIGWQHRKHGLAIDNLLSVDLMTADGDLVTASEGENADLFWGVRGGGGNFGIVTSFEFRTNPVGPVVLAGPILWPVEKTSQLLAFYRDWVADSPDELMTIVVQRRVAPGQNVPRDLVGQRVVGVVACYVGSVEDGEQIVRPLRGFDSPLLDMCEPKPFLDHQRMFDASFRHGCHYYVRSCDVDELNDDVIGHVADFGSRIESPLSSIAIWQMGGAVSRVGDDETAFHGRNAGFTFNINGNTETAQGFDDEREWARSYWSALAAHHTTVYVNFLMEENEDRIRAAYGPTKYEKLKTLKSKYDPTNFFRLNQNIPPN